MPSKIFRIECDDKSHCLVDGELATASLNAETIEVVLNICLKPDPTKFTVTEYTRSEMESARGIDFDDGHEKGLDEGYGKGFKEGFKEGCEDGK